MSPGQDRAGDELASMSLLEHLEELRNRLLKSLAALLIAFLLCWAFSRQLFRFLARPIYAHLPPGEKLVFLSVTDPFMLYIKVAILAALFVASPYLLFQAWRFVAPGLYRGERRHGMVFILSGTFLFVAGGAFAYYVAFPFAVDFLLSVGEDFTPAITGPGYLRFLMTVMVGLGVMFELPVMIFLLARFGLVTPRFLLRHFRWAVLVIFVLAALITPTPDVFNMCLFAVPTLLLYLLGIAAAWLFAPDRKRVSESAAGEEVR
jgi:sec-independent protein translocase protein TatC